jgi:hypothetical protein
MRLPILVLHIIAGTLGMLSGFVAMSLRKGSRQHGIAGTVFVVSMLCLGASGAYLAVMKHQMGNFLGGVFTFYLVSTAWMTARRKDNQRQTGIFDWVALLVVLAVSAINLTYGLEAAYSPSGAKGGYAAGLYFFSAALALLAATGDIRMLVRGGVTGAQRLARHLWRMCYAQFIAAASIFLARQHLFPALFRKTGVLFFLSFLPILVLIFWLIRVRFTHGNKRKTWVATGSQPSLATR